MQLTDFFKTSCYKDKFFSVICLFGFCRKNYNPSNFWYSERQLHYLWRAVDQDGETIDILVQKHKDTKAPKRFFKKLLKKQCRTPYQLVTDKLKSYGAAKNELMPSATHIQDRYKNNRAEN